MQEAFIPFDPQYTHFQGKQLTGSLVFPPHEYRSFKQICHHIQTLSDQVNGSLNTSLQTLSQPLPQLLENPVASVKEPQTLRLLLQESAFFHEETQGEPQKTTSLRRSALQKINLLPMHDPRTLAREEVDTAITPDNFSDHHVYEEEMFFPGVFDLPELSHVEVNPKNGSQSDISNVDTTEIPLGNVMLPDNTEDNRQDVHTFSLGEFLYILLSPNTWPAIKKIKQFFGTASYKKVYKEDQAILAAK